MLRKCAVVPVLLDQERGTFFSTYFIVPKKNGGLCPIVNLKFFNKAVTKRRFKMETLHSIMTVLSPGQWMASLDLKDVYFHVPIRAEHHRFLRFHWL